jgi:hypothetical protein
MYDLKINGQDKNNMIMAINSLCDDKSHTPQQVIDPIRKTLLPDYAPLGKRTLFEYEWFNAHSNTLPDPDVVKNTQESDVLELDKKLSKMSINDTPSFPKPNQGEKEKKTTFYLKQNKIIKEKR